MAQGYFRNGSVNVELGRHVFVTPTGQRRSVVLEPHDEEARILDSGGGVLSLEVTGLRLRENLGDAERYIYELFSDLGMSDPGALGHEDNRGHRSVFGDSVCRNATGEVRAFEMADMRFSFVSPEKQSEPAWASVPSAPGIYGGTSTSQDYEADGISLGVGGSMRIEMYRDQALREIPRARGSRTTIPPRAAHLRFVVTVAHVAEANNLALHLENLLRTIGPRRVDLTGNGNTYENVLLERMTPKHRDVKHTTVEFEFLKEI